jgi:hypothetical protein
LSEISELKVAQVISTNETSQISLIVIKFTQLNSVSNQTNKTFRVSNGWLLFNAENAALTTASNKDLVYLLETNLCSNQANLLNIVVSTCRKTFINVHIHVDIDSSELSFSEQEFNFKFYNLNDQFYFGVDDNQHYEMLSQSNGRLIDAKKLFKHSNILSIGNLTELNLKMSKNLNQLFYLNKKNGFIYATNFSELFSSNQTTDHTLEIEKSNQKSSAKINMKNVKIDNQLNVSISANSFNNSATNNIIIVETNVASKLEKLGFRFDKLTCINLDSITCLLMFEYNFSNDYLMVNKSLALDHLVIDAFQLLLNFYSIDGFRLELNLKLNIDFDQQNDFFDSNVSKVKLIDTKTTCLNLYLFDKTAQLSASRVRNIITNTLVLTLDFKLSKSDQNSFYLELNDTTSIDSNQLYAIDIGTTDSSFRARQTFYLARLDSDLETIKLRKYLDLISLTDLNIKLSTIEYDNNVQLFQIDSDASMAYLQNITLIDRIEAFPDCKVGLNDFIRLTGDQIHFSSGQNFFGHKVFGSGFNINLFKFIVDKVSLRILKVIQFEVGKLFNLIFLFNL